MAVVAPPPWADLPQDLLRVVSGLLHDATDFIRFHAVCEPWRGALPTTVHPAFLPWLRAPWGRIRYLLRFRCVFSKTSYSALTRYIAPDRSIHPTWVASADGAAAWLFTTRPKPILLNPLTGAITRRLPRFPDDNIKLSMEKADGIVYSDGTTFLYSLSGFGENTSIFRAAILRHGDAAWMVVERTLAARGAHCCAAYHDGKILVSVDANFWRVIMTPNESNVGGGNDSLYMHEVTCMPYEDGNSEYLRKYSYVMESRGELLRASVLLQHDWHCYGQGAGSLARALSVSVHALEVEADSGKMRWVRRDGQSLGDRVLFLGCPNSFAMDASKLHGDDVSGGCAYFVHKSWGSVRLPCNVFRYSLLDSKAKLMERLPPEWEDEMCMWLVPQPAISPSQEIRDRLKASNKKQQPVYPIRRSPIHRERRPQYTEPFFSFSVHNLPLRVDSSRLHQFFSKHGKVAAAEVISPGIGHVTMATVDGPADAEAALDGLVLDGCTMVVSRVKQRRRRGKKLPLSTGAA